jgi:integrase
LADYRAYLTNKGNTLKHVGQVVSAITACLSGCRFVRVADVQPSAVVGFIADLRAAGRGITTANLTLTYLKSFTRWLLRDRRTVADPLAGLSRLANGATDVRHARRDFAADELRQLLETTRTSGRTFRGLTGLDRAAIYATAVGTGFRVAELASLTPADFDLDAHPPAIRVDASYAKNRKEASQPIPPELASCGRAGSPARGSPMMCSTRRLTRSAPTCCSSRSTLVRSWAVT